MKVRSKLDLRKRGISKVGEGRGENRSAGKTRDCVTEREEGKRRTGTAPIHRLELVFPLLERSSVVEEKRASRTFPTSFAARPHSTPTQLPCESHSGSPPSPYP